MGLHKLEIEVTDELLSRIDKVSAQTQHSRAQVVVETLKDHLPGDLEQTFGGADARRQALRHIFDMTENLGPGRSQEESDEDVRAWRQDRDHGR